MDVAAGALWLLDGAARELLLFAAVGLLIGGADDLLLDCIWIGRSLGRRLFVFTRHDRGSVASLAPPERPGRIAVFVPAWDEATVIGAMLRAALARFDHADYRLYVGVYPNDRATVDAVAGVAADDDRVRLAVNAEPGPTTKADCLNRLWRAMVEDERTEGRPFKAVVLHDAEDVVHSAELRLFDVMIERFDLVQLPVLPLVDPTSRWIGGHYIDEFAEAHGRQLVVREALGASVPSAGVGCAISRDMLAALAAEGGGSPFDAASLTEDYEIGLRIRDRGGRGAFVSMPAVAGGPGPVAVRAHFPGTIGAAVRQKTRWTIGIALSGWDRLGWRGGWAERWMRLRDRRAIFSAIVLLAAYGSLLLWLGYWIAERSLPTLSPALHGLLAINSGVLAWRLAMRGFGVTRFYGCREGLRAVLRAPVANAIAVMAAWRAVVRYASLARGGAIGWDKTHHIFPSALPAE